MKFSLSLTLAVGVSLANAKRLRSDFVDRLLLGEQTACKASSTSASVLGSQQQECTTDPKPKCTPFRNVEYCPTDESFQTYIQARSSFVKTSPDAIEDAGYWFHHLEDKMVAYKVSDALGLHPPKIYHCTDDIKTILTFEPPSGVTGFVVRATDLHSNVGIYVLPNGFGQRESLSGMNMTAIDIEAELSKHSDAQGGVLLIEEYVGTQQQELPMEFKFHMFDGKVGSVNVVANRGSDCACWAEMDENQSRLDQYGCFTSGGGEETRKDGQCTSIDFQQGTMRAHPMKGMDICSDLQVVDDCVMKDMIAIATKASEAIGVYVRVDMFLGGNGEIYVQEYSTNHMNGLRHCSARVNSTTGCVDPCFQGTMWKEAAGNTTFGGPKTRIPDAVHDWMRLPGDRYKCSDIVMSTPTPPSTPSSCSTSAPVVAPTTSNTPAPTADA